LSADEALDALESLPPAQLAEGIRYLEQNNPDAVWPLLQAYTDRAERQKLEGAWAHLDNLSAAADAMDARREAEQDAQFAQAEHVARGMVSEEFRKAGAGRIDIDTGLAAADAVADAQIAAWEREGYTQEEINERMTPEFGAWAIRTAAELGRQASISHYALGKV
jgi:hypothetical protein